MDLRFIIVFILITSCSWVTSGRGLTDGKKTQTHGVKSSTVSREQYNDLLKKYQVLLQQARQKNNLDSNSEDHLVNELMNAKNNATENINLAETVDVFGKDGILKKAKASTSLVSLSLGTGQNIQVVENQITMLMKANSLLKQSKHSKALEIFKDLENSKTLPIRVRAKYGIGEIMFAQGEYDLAIQIYEDIIHQYAFSGLVIKVLGRLIVCTEKLKLDKKKDQYFSILHDFFEAT